MACCPTCGQGLPADGLVVDVGARRLLIDGRIIALQPIQSAILTALVGRMPECVQTDRIMTAIYGADGGPDTAEVALRVTICDLRRRLAATSLRIVNHRGQGYSLHRDPARMRIRRVA